MIERSDRLRRSAGFTLIELLVVVAIIGILAAIAISNYLSALTRARQKRTMADMRTIAAAWETRAADAQSYRAAGSFTFPAATVDTTAMTTMLVPTYMKTVPLLDGWQTAIQFSTGRAGQAEIYALRSAGRDREFESEPYNVGVTDDPDADLVFAAGQFIQYPEGMK